MCRNHISAAGERRVSFSIPSSRLFFWILALLTAVALRSGRGYRPFPAPDDLAYIPLVWAAGNPALYPRDTLVQEYQVLLHAPLWKWLVVTAESTVGLPWGFWVATTLLTIASVLALARLLRLLGAPGYFLPVAAVLAYGASVGLGRGKVRWRARQQHSDPIRGALPSSLVLRRLRPRATPCRRCAAWHGFSVAPPGRAARRVCGNRCCVGARAKRPPRGLRHRRCCRGRGGARHHSDRTQPRSESGADRVEQRRSHPSWLPLSITG